MAFEGWGFTEGFYLGLPLRWAGYLLLIAYLGLCVLAWMLRNDAAHSARRAGKWRLTLALMLIAPLTAQGLTFRLQASGALSAPGQPLIPGGPAFSLLGAVPWMLAAGYLGIGPAILVGAVSGLARAGWGTSQLLTVVATAAQAGAMAWLLRSDYQGWPGRLMRRPILSAAMVGIAFGALGAIEEFSYSRGDFYSALDFSLSRLGPTVLARAVELMLGGLIVEAFRYALPDRWYRPDQLVVGPYNRSLAARLTTMLLVLGAGAAVVLTFTNWALARNSAQELVSEQMIRIAAQTSEGVPLFIQTGRLNMRQLASDLELGPLTEDELEIELQAQRRTLTYFGRLAIFDQERSLVASAPAGEPSARPLPLEVEAAVASALGGIPLEVTTAPPTQDDGVQLVFLTPLTNAQGSVQGVLVGWVDLARTPLLRPVLAGLEGHVEGEAFLVDERGVILMHPDPSRWLERIDPGRFTDFEVRAQAAPSGARELVYSQPVEGYSWRVVLATPQQAVDTLALSSTLNLLSATVLIGALVILTAFLSTRRLTRPLRELAKAAESIASGNLERPAAHRGDDELGSLAESFERMRLSLRRRLQELGLLLDASRQLAESFELAQTVPPILANLRELILADAVRLVLAPNGADRTALETYHAGDVSQDWAILDRQVLELCREQGQFALDNASRARTVLDVAALTEPLESLAALPLQHEESYLGVLWLAQRQPRGFSGTELDLVAILAAHLGTSLANTRLYHQAEGERNRLLAILESTPDAVIAVDRQGRLLLANSASEAVLEQSAAESIGRPAEDCLKSPELVLLLAEPAGEDHTTEIKVEGGRMLYASATEVYDGAGVSLGRVAVLWDVTQYKVLDTLKSEFVSTVSHDLRAPLTLMRGYATMLSMVGEVNEQQQEFVEKILNSVERMTKLVDDLLDLSRIETGIGLSLTEVHIEEVIEDVIANFRPQAVNKQVALQADIADALEPIDADPMLIRQAIANLVDNAVKFTAAGGQVLVKVSQSDGRQIVSVEDSGAGIAPADQPRLFEKFFRARRVEGEGKRGSGLGLAIVKSIVEQHHGRVQVESRLGVGSKFTLAFPMRQLQPEPVG